jgi:hypothetical protein
MLTQLEQAKIPHIVCSLQWQPGTLSNQLAAPAGGIRYVQGSEDLYDKNLGIEIYCEDPTSGFVDFFDQVNPKIPISANGIDPTPAGYQQMIQMVIPAIQAAHAGELR